MSGESGAVAGRLVVVGTPIGNLGDLSQRAVDALAGASVVACEDTRRTGRLLAHVGVEASLLRLDANVERVRTPELIGLIAAGEIVALVSDAGMPALSDPGSFLIRAVRAGGFAVEVVPGPFAGAVAFVASGLGDESGRFVFEGFLPRRGRHRADRLRAVAGSDCAAVLYESPQRIAATVADLLDVCGPDRRVALCRELTKLHEEVWVGSLAAAGEHLQGNRIRGEFVLVVDVADAPEPVADQEIRERITAELAAGASRRDAARTVADRLGVPVNRVKRLVDP
ncbi:MAG: 16S rRNA (cytidine(1402)-2'-O)-methyltransferase [Actinomycetota bacterium]|nr:16S rRNA (cytidine(1402)-2'-O)-methyltransferase [Actinomycetota bacterium]